MEDQQTILDKAVKISIIAGALIIALSVAYYLVIFLPKKEATRLEVQGQEKQEAAKEKEEVSEEPTITPPFLEKAPVLQNAPAIIEQQQSAELTDAEFAASINDIFVDQDLAYTNANNCLTKDYYANRSFCTSISSDIWEQRRSAADQVLRPLINQTFAHVHNRNPTSAESDAWFDRTIKSDISGPAALLRKLRYYEERGSTFP